MSIAGDGGDDRRTRLERMIDEFRDAQSRRLARTAAARGDEQVVDSQRATHAPAAVKGSTSTPTSH